MTDYSDLVQRLRGKKLNCTCAAKSASECCCDTYWPESYCNEAADAIEHLMKEIDVLDDHWRKDKKQIEALERIAQKQSDELNVLRGSIANYQVGVHEDRISELEAEIEAANHVLDLCGIPFHDDNGKKYSLKQRLETRIIAKQGAANE